MFRTVNRRHALALCAVAAAWAAGPVRADTWPSRPIRWVVAYPAGGGSDFLARQLAPQLGKQLGQALVIDNRPGAAGIIGTDNAAKSPPDGYTIVTGDNGAMVFHEAMYKKIPNAGFTSGKQLLEELKKSPGKYSYASPGIGSPHHLAMELLKDRTKTFVVHVPYRGTALAVQDVISGQVPMMVLDTAAGLPQIRSGKVKALAVMSKKRIPSLPDVPTLDELGVKDFEVTAWQGLFVPKGTPAEIVTRLTAEMTKAITTPEVKTKLEDFGLDVVPTDGPALGAFIQKETIFWHALIKERKLSAE
jgi:tripartite-type tricarboxylate transporter receptor subunit TctC